MDIFNKENQIGAGHRVILYTDGGCWGNQQRNFRKRKMIAVVSDDKGNVLVERKEKGGSNNIAELMAVDEALKYCIKNNIANVEIRTDSKNNFAWVLGRKVGKNVNDKSKVMQIKESIRQARTKVYLHLKWVGRDSNLAGHYIENNYSV